MAVKTTKREKAAKLVAEDRLSDVKIASEVGISGRTLERWKGEPAFQERVAAVVKAYADQTLNSGLARRERRIQVLSELHDKLLMIMQERSCAPEYAPIPGGKTGLLLRRVKGLNAQGGEFETGTGLVKEVRSLQEQVCRDVGQWKEKQEITGNNGGPLAYQDLTDQQLDERIRELEEKLNVKG